MKYCFVNNGCPSQSVLLCLLVAVFVARTEIAYSFSVPAHTHTHTHKHTSSTYTSTTTKYNGIGRDNVALKVATGMIAPPPVSEDETKTSSIKTTNEKNNDLLSYDKEGYPKLGSIMKALPDEVFQVSTKTSLFYFAIDSIAVIASIGLLHGVVTSNIYHSLALWQQALTVAPFQLLAGFAMWCQWCIGHDAGHSLISKKHKWLNNFVGEISHSMFCLTPFIPWQMSHRKHHINHNHVEKDYSHQWFVRENKDEMVWWMKASHATRNIQLPILYFVYLMVGVPDGGHVIPFYGRLWEDQTLKTKFRGLLSSCLSIATAGSLWNWMGTADFSVVCMVPWMVMSFWLFMVTYLQHHSEEGKLYTDKTHTFVKGAFETVDRSYGKWTNKLSHHMMDGHVMHHLFFEKVPHYQLEKATKSLTAVLQKEDRMDLYKSIETKSYTKEIVKQFNDNWFFVNEKQIIRE
jgi:omega-3 fatty acid desaturase (delta-15 desaturase)